MKVDGKQPLAEHNSQTLIPNCLLVDLSWKIINMPSHSASNTEHNITRISIDESLHIQRSRNFSFLCTANETQRSGERRWRQITLWVFTTCMETCVCVFIVRAHIFLYILKYTNEENALAPPAVRHCYVTIRRRGPSCPWLSGTLQIRPVCFSELSTLSFNWLNSSK